MAAPVFNGDLISATSPFINVKFYGAKGDGTTDDTTALQNAFAAVPAGGGIVYAPPGHYKITTAMAPKDGTMLLGAGVNATVFIAPAGVQGGAGSFIQLGLAQGSFYTLGLTLRDFSVDCSNQYRPGARGALGSNAPSGINVQGINNLLIENVRVINPSGYGINIGAGGGTTQQVSNVRLRNIFISGEWNGQDSIGGGGINGGCIENYICQDPAGTGLDIVWATNFSFRNIYVSFPTTTALNGCFGVASDSGNIGCTYDSIFVDSAYVGFYMGGIANPGASGNAPAEITLTNFSITNARTQGIWFNTALGKIPSNIFVKDGYIAGWNAANAGGQGIRFEGGNAIDIHDVNFGAPGTAGSYAAQFTMDGGHGSGGTNLTKLRLHDCDVTLAPAGFFLQDVDATCRVYDCPGWNPKGYLGAVAVPASGTPFTNAFNTPAEVFITGGTVTAITVGGTDTGLTSGAFVVQPNQTIAITYSVAPTWKWFGI